MRFPGRLGNQVVEEVLYLPTRLSQVRLQGFPVREAGQERQLCPRHRLARQRLGLLVLHGLERVFNTALEAIVRCQTSRLLS